MITLAWVLGIALSVSFVCSIMEAVLLSINHSFVAVLKDRGERAGDYLEAMQRKIDEPISAILTLNTIAATMGAAISGGLALQVFGEEWVAIFSAGLTLTILLFAEIVPKTLGATFWKQLAKPTVYLLRGMVLVMKPVLLPLSLFSRMVTPGGTAERATVSRAELEVLAEIGRREGTLDEEEWRVVKNVMNLADVPVSDVMTPRTDMVAVPMGASVDEAQSLMLETGHLRLPVYEDDLDRIVGIVLARDLWRAERQGVTDVRDVRRDIPFVPATKPVESLIREMRRQRTKMVIVLDEFGGTAGLATLEDLIEEVVGEIQDEHERDEPLEFQEIGEGELRIWGGVPLRETNERLGLRLPEDRHDTLGGFLFGELNRVPVPGDRVVVEGGEFQILRMRGRRVEFVRFTPA